MVLNKYFLIIAGIFALHTLNSCKRSSVSFTTWKNDASSAYSIIMDDYGTEFFGNLDIIDSTLENRGLHVSFATISHWEDISDSLRAKRFVRARELFAKGHEFVNHSAHHICGGKEWDLAMEIDSSKAFIERMIPGNKVLFFAFPCGETSKKRLDYIKQREYIGARCEGSVNDVIISDPYLVSRSAYEIAGGINELNGLVDNGIQKAGWAIRLTHNVWSDTSSGWETIATELWTEHLDYCVEKVKKNEIWFAPVQEVLKYAMERENFTIEIKKETDDFLELAFITNKVEINPSPFVENELYDEDLSISVKAKGREDIIFNANPWGGPVRLNFNNDKTINITQGKMRIYPL